MKKTFEPARIDVMRFQQRDVITTSTPTKEEGETSNGKENVGFGDPTMMPD